MVYLIARLFQKRSICFVHTSLIIVVFPDNPVVVTINVYSQLGAVYAKIIN